MSIDSPKKFFQVKKNWSRIKDRLLAWYLKPYLAKIFNATDNFYLIDGFAGPGLFEDGEKGSPLIETDILNDCLKSTSNKRININLICVEKDKGLFKSLEKNMAHVDFATCYNDTIENILPNFLKTAKKNSAVFLYLDPFGINGIPLNLEEILSKRKDIKFELLLNFNSFGCYRECKRLLNDYKEFESYFAENGYLIDTNNNIERMNSLLGTADWPAIINNPNPEFSLSRLFCQQLKQSFKYVLNYPVRYIKNGVVKYRMIHCTDYSVGACLMAQNMLESMKNSSVLSLFDTDLEGDIVDKNNKILSLLKYIPEAPSEPIRLSDLVMTFYEKEGIFCTPKELLPLLRDKEEKGELIVDRRPSKTDKGNTTKFWDENKGHIVLISKRSYL